MQRYTLGSYVGSLHGGKTGVHRDRHRHPSVRAPGEGSLGGPQRPISHRSRPKADGRLSANPVAAASRPIRPFRFRADLPDCPTKVLALERSRPAEPEEPTFGLLQGIGRSAPPSSRLISLKFVDGTKTAALRGRCQIGGMSRGPHDTSRRDTALQAPGAERRRTKPRRREGLTSSHAARPDARGSS